MPKSEINRDVLSGLIRRALPDLIAEATRLSRLSRRQRYNAYMAQFMRKRRAAERAAKTSAGGETV